MAARIEERSRAAATGGRPPGKIAGVWCPVLTPVDQDLNPDAARFVAHARWLLDEGCHGLVVFGTTGEANSFSVDERIALLEAILEAGLPRHRLVVGTGCCALTDTVRLTRHARSLGITGVLALPPFYYKNNSDDALFGSFDQVIQRVGDTDFSLYLYHFPSLSGVPITPGLLERLGAAYPGTLAGVKDSSGDWNTTRLLIERFPELAIFPGAETLLLPALQAGGAGCISASCNVNARQIRRLYDDYEAGAGGLQEQQEQLNAVRKVLQLRPMIPVMKHLIADERSDPAWRRVRPPLLPLPDVEARAGKRAPRARLAHRPGVSLSVGLAPGSAAPRSRYVIAADLTTCTSPSHSLFPKGAVCELHDLIEDQIFGIMAAPGDGSSDPASGLQAVHMPWVLNRAVGRCGALAGHVARANPVWTTFAPGRELLVIFQGPHCYVSPDWYANPGLVPTWNYLAVHCYGSPRILEDPDAVLAHLARLSALAEERLLPKRPWTLERVEPTTLAALLPQIVAFEIEITRIEGKRKLNQNRRAADRAGVIHALEGSSRGDDLAIAEAMRDV